MAESVLDAVNAALAGETNDPTPEVETDDTGVDTSADAGGVVETGDDPNAAGDTGTDDQSGEQGGDDAGDDQPEGEGGETDIAAEAEKLGISKRNADGTFKSAEQVAAEVAAAQAAAAKGGKPGERADGKKPADKKEPDALNDPIPEGLNAKTTQRIRTLIERTRSAEEKAQTAESDFNYLVQGVQSTGATPEQYGETLAWLKLFNSRDPAQQKKALDLIEDTADQLATLLGVERRSSDPLRGHPDLLEAIQKGTTTRQFALEVARNRNQAAFRQQIHTTASEQEQAAQRAAQERDNARVALNQLEERLMASDPQYEQKLARIMPTLKVVMAQIPPAKWQEAFQRAYDQVRIVARPAPQQQQRPAGRRPVNQPLRAGKNPSGTGAAGGSLASQPKSALDAVNAALSSMG